MIKPVGEREHAKHSTQKLNEIVCLNARILAGDGILYPEMYRT